MGTNLYLYVVAHCHCWICGLFLEMRWLIVRDYVVHCWICGGLLSETWLFPFGDEVAQC